MDMAMELPDDLLADVLRRLPPHSLAAARCVHSSWRAIIDTRRLMHLLPLRLAGILINFNGHNLTELFARPTPSPTVSAKFHQYLPDGARDAIVMDHCNGLLLLEGGYVVNPATRQWATLPSPRPPCRYGEKHFCYHEYIMFDPDVSPHYEVLVVPEAYRRETLEPRVEEWEWPPSPMLLHAFSSRTNRWEERSFERRGEAFGTIADLPLSDNQTSVVYWHGHLYVHHYFFMRISLSSSKYQVIKLPQDINLSSVSQGALARSEKGVYLASIDSYTARLQVWILDESCACLEWVMKYRADIRHILSHRSCNPKVHGSWVMEDINYHSYHDIFPDYKEQAPPENGFEWDSDNEDVLDTKDKIEGEYGQEIYIIGFHPQKEVVFLCESLERGFAYHLSTSKLQELGNMYPTHYDWFAEGYNIESSFPYTPCRTSEFPADN
ncbi:uncharacterized protein [Triticum aestivum]|uniref:uncharacterized protein n=1 Tax=Triticum aestivum TaxID=4565 RepID=UPI001D0121F7|nr:uncharacterized protein LOC123186661 [Triticum aestivum]